MLTPIDGKSKMMYVIYGDELARRAGPPRVHVAHGTNQACAQGQLPKQLVSPDCQEHGNRAEAQESRRKI